MMGESLVARYERQQREVSARMRNALLYGTSHPEIYKQEQDPMSITLRIEEIANGWLIHSSEQEYVTANVGRLSASGPYYLPDADAVRRKLPELFDDAVAEAKAREARHKDEERAMLNQSFLEQERYVRDHAAHDGPIPDFGKPTIYGEDSTTAPSKGIVGSAWEIGNTLRMGSAIGKPGFTIGGEKFMPDDDGPAPSD